MFWMDYNINQSGHNFKVEGEWEGEVMGVKKDGTEKDYWLYKQGDVFRVNESGWLVKISEAEGAVRDR